jgi:hypothetical protein
MLRAGMDQAHLDACNNIIQVCLVLRDKFRGLNPGIDVDKWLHALDVALQHKRELFDVPKRAASATTAVSIVKSTEIAIDTIAHFVHGLTRTGSARAAAAAVGADGTCVFCVDFAVRLAAAIPPPLVAVTAPLSMDELPFRTVLVDDSILKHLPDLEYAVLSLT